MVQSTYNCRVYYEDTDCLGMVYHANYLKYLERGRTHHIESIAGTSLQDLNATGIVFVVRKMSLKFIKPATLGDQLEISTTAIQVERAEAPDINRRRAHSSKFTRELHQRILRNEEPILTARVELACLDATGTLTPWPDIII